MGTSKHVAFLLTVALAAILTAGPDQSATRSQAASGPSNTRSTSCIVRIAVDPAVLPLSPESVSSLIHSPAVQGKALREVLSVNSLEDFLRSWPQLAGVVREPVTIRWLNTPSAQEPSVNLSRTPGESDIAYRTRVAQVRNVQQMMKSRGTGMGGGAGQSATIELQVHLPDTVPARADEFLKGVVKNLQEGLSRAHESYQEGLAGALIEAKTQHLNVENELDGRENDVARVKQQLEKLVDVSQWNRQMPLEKAIEVLSRSVEPPLNIVVLWRDMMSNAHMEPTSPINIEGSPKIRLATALDLLVKGFDAGVDTARPTWRIQDDTIVIGTTATRGGFRGMAGQPQVETDARNLAEQRSELARRILSLELDLAGLKARQQAIRERISAIKFAADKQLADDPVTRELENLQHTSEINLANLKKQAEAGRVAAPELAQAEEGVARIRIDLARRREELSRQAGGGQLEEFTKELSHLTVDKAEKEAQLEVVRKQLDEVQKQLAQALTFDPEAARLRLAQESLDITTRRVAELQTRLANLQPPMVTVIGAN